MSILQITSAAFEDGQPIPTSHTADGADVSPPLSWSGVPEGTKQLALICDDPDAPTPQPWVHWIIFDLPPDCAGLPEGVPRQARLDDPAGACQGVNSWPTNDLGYRGPAPPPGHGTHHYHFKLYALDTALDLKPGIDKHTLVQAMRGHAIGEGELIGTYER